MCACYDVCIYKCMSRPNCIHVHVHHCLYRTEQNQLKDIKFDFIPGKGILCDVTVNNLLIFSQLSSVGELSTQSVYMLGTILKPSAHFKAVRTVLKPSGPFQSRLDGFEAVGAKICPSGRPASAPSNFEGAYSKKGRVSELYHV